MWFLKNDNSGKLIYLRSKGTMTVGRKKGYIVLPDDGSISRVHAEITVTPVLDFNQITDVSQPLSECIIKDAGSKYGNFIMKDGTAAAITKEGYKLHHLDCVRFGLQNYIFTIHYIPIITATSGLSATEKKQLEIEIEAIDGKVANFWSPLCTHMTFETSVISEKLSCALVNQNLIVPMAYWKSVAKAVAENKELPDPMAFASFIDNKMRQLGDITVRPNIARKTLFKNWTFVHFNAKQYALYSRMIQLAGGKPVQYGKLRTNPDVCDNNVIVVQYVESSTTQATGTGDANYAAVCEKLNECRRRSIPDSEIAIAILHGSTEIYCNPKYDYAAIFATRETQNKHTDLTVLALDTQDVNNLSISSCGKENKSKKSAAQQFKITQPESMNCIPESVEPAYADSQITMKCHKSSSNDTTNKGEGNVCRSKDPKTSGSVNCSLRYDLSSVSQIGSMKVASLNHENYLHREFHEKAPMNGISAKRGREIGDDGSDKTMKKMCIESSSVDKSRSLEQKTVQCHIDMLSDDEDIFFVDAKMSLPKEVNTFLEKKEVRQNSAIQSSTEQEFRFDKVIDFCIDDDVTESKSVSSSAQVEKDRSGRHRTLKKEKRNTFKDPFTIPDDENPRKRKIGRSFFSPFSDSTGNELNRNKPEYVNDEQSDGRSQAAASRTENISVESPSSPSKNKRECVFNEENNWVDCTRMDSIGSEKNTSVRSHKSNTFSAPYETSRFFKLPNDPNSTMVPLLRVKSIADLYTENGPKFGKCFRKQKITIADRIEIDGSTYMKSSSSVKKQN